MKFTKFVVTLSIAVLLGLGVLGTRPVMAEKMPNNILQIDSSKKACGRVVGYLPSYRSEQVDKIDYSVLTHINLAFMRYQNGTLKSDFSDSLVKKIMAHCKENNIKVCIAIGGGGGFDAESKPFHTKESRAAFIRTITDYVAQYGLDGVDVDIENTDEDVLANYENLVRELREALGEEKLLTMAVSPWFTKKLGSGIYEYLDFLNLMTYDYSGAYGIGNGPIAPMSQIEDHKAFYTSQGVSMDRMNIGVPFYGYGSGGWNDEYTFSQIVAYNSEYRYTDDALINGNRVYYNGETTIREKARLSKDFGGIMIWELGQDSFGVYSLLAAIKDELYSQSVVKVEIEGWRISPTSDGYSTIYSVTDLNQEVESVGLIYGLKDRVNTSEMTATSGSKQVYISEATDKGKLKVGYSKTAKAKSYSMTMKLIHDANFYNAGIYTRAYAKLRNGTYVYSDVEFCRVFDVADYIYQNKLLNDQTSYDYLYDNILKKTDANYIK